MATSPYTQHARADATLEAMGIQLTGTADYDAVTRRQQPLLSFSRFGRSEPFETLRDALNRETRLRLTSPGEFRLTVSSRTGQTWSGYGQTVTLSKASFLGSWTLRRNGVVVLEDATRLEAFEAAAEQMFDIVNRQ